MSKLNIAHLNDDQFTDCLMGLQPEGEVAKHLAGCQQCRLELDRFTGAVGDFSTAAMAWSEAQPVVKLRPEVIRSAARRPYFVTAGWALAAGLVLAIAAPRMVHHDQPGAAEASVKIATVNVAEDSPAQIAQDNRLMNEVTAAIGRGEPSPYNEYEITPVRSVGHKHRTESRLQ